RNSVIARGMRLVFVRLSRFNRVSFPEPATQVDKLAARAAKRELRPRGVTRTVHRTSANRAEYVHHRNPKFRTWTISLWLSSHLTCLRRRLYRLQRIWRSPSLGRMSWSFHAPGQPWPRPCRIHSDNPSHRSQRL